MYVELSKSGAAQRPLTTLRRSTPAIGRERLRRDYD
jgi:hypothetical protein